MLDQIFAQLRAAVGDVKAKAAKDLSKWDANPYAMGLRDGAAEIESVLSMLDSDFQTLTPAQYAEIHGVTPQTVTTWIRRGELEATGDRDIGYSIRRSAVRSRKLSIA